MKISNKVYSSNYISPLILASKPCTTHANLPTFFSRNSNYEFLPIASPPQRDLPKRYCIHNSIHNRYGYIREKRVKFLSRKHVSFAGENFSAETSLNRERLWNRSTNDPIFTDGSLSLSLCVSHFCKLEKPTNLTVLRLSKRAIVTLVERRKTSTGRIRSLCIAQLSNNCIPSIPVKM